MFPWYLLSSLPFFCPRLYINISSYFSFPSPSLSPSHSKEIRRTCDGILTLTGAVCSPYSPLNRLMHTQKISTHSEAMHKFKHKCHVCSSSCHISGMIAVIFPSLALRIRVRGRVCVPLSCVFVFCVTISCWLTSVNVPLSLIGHFSEIALSLSVLILVPPSAVSYCVFLCMWTKSSSNCQ